MPALKGLKFGAAKTALAAAGCSLGKLERKAVKKPKPGVVLSQSPSAGRVLAKGARVNVTVSKKPKKGKGKR